MNLKNIPILGEIDFSDPAKRRRSILICVVGALLALAAILVVARRISDRADAQDSPQETVYESPSVPLGRDNDALKGKTIRDVSGKRRGRAGEYAENLFSDNSAENDPLAVIKGESPSVKVADPLNESDNKTPSFLQGTETPGRRDVYPERTESRSEGNATESKNRSRSVSPASTSSVQPASSASSRESSLSTAEQRRRELYRQHGLDENGNPIPGGPADVSPRKPAAKTSATSGSTSGASSTNASDPASTDQGEPVIEQARVQVRKSGGVSAFGLESGTSGTSLTSLGEEDQFVSNDPSHPFKVKFAYNEKVSSGQRVTIRLCEDMVVDGVLIPVNTHLFATCSVGDRLQLNVSSIDINGKIYTLNYTAYDNDGAEGLYCPQSESSKMAKQLGEEASQLAQQAVQTAITGYPSRILQSGASAVRQKNGAVTVSVTAGYTFYLLRSTN